MQVAILVFDGVSAAEALGPFEIFRRVPGVDTRFVARHEGPYTVHGSPGLIIADRALHDVRQPDVVFVPGGFGTRRLMLAQSLLDWLRVTAGTAECVAGVSTGSLLLAAARALDGVEATTHWLVLDELEALGARPVAAPIVERGRVITAGGGASALEVAYCIVGRMFGADVALGIRSTLAEESQADVGHTRRRLRRPRVRARTAAEIPADEPLSPYVLD